MRSQFLISSFIINFSKLSVAYAVPLLRHETWYFVFNTVYCPIYIPILMLTLHLNLGLVLVVLIKLNANPQLKLPLAFHQGKVCLFFEWPFCSFWELHPFTMEKLCTPNREKLYTFIEDVCSIVRRILSLYWGYFVPLLRFKFFFVEGSFHKVISLYIDARDIFNVYPISHVT